ncbi:hypothetical protein M413DRAFT_13676 [Hebeloma cylindrosporum]|uniref:Uncharacterized protein n=1 Tax=Hebeloma cylindrosporum TaxID=76867 RepID=A0A0C3BZQ2_HEBCY|nr:hypothetical protein M413DRAFT_13676 [Hebeloma cylindrosporum h7]
MRTKYLQLVSQSDNGRFWNLRSRDMIEIKELQIDLCQSLRAPIRKLPVETLCTIFAMCIPPPHKRPTNRSAPFVLCLVSKAWRDIVTQDPTLWTRIHFDITSTAPNRRLGHNRNRDQFRSLIHRARNIPLTISITQRRGDLDLRQFYELLHLIAECTPLCKHLLIQSYTGWTKELRSLEPQQLQRLESLSVRLHHPFFHHSFSVGTTGDVFSALPKLQTAEVHVRNPETLLAFSLPTNALLKLSVIVEFFYTPAYSLDFSRAFITRFRNLRNLHLILHGKGFSHPGFIPDVVNTSKSLATFHSLKEITIRCGFRASLSTILDGFSFPSLQSFNLDAVSVPVRIISKDFVFSDVLRKHMTYFSRLTSLRLLRIDIEDDQLRELLQFTPLLASLDIMRGYFRNHEFLLQDDDLLEFLTVLDDGDSDEISPPVPRLTDLRLYFDPEHAGLYAKMALSRHNWAVKRLGNDRGAARSYSATTVPRYPFRLSLKLEKTEWESRKGVIDDLGTLGEGIIRTEPCHSFIRWKI